MAWGSRYRPLGGVFGVSLALVLSWGGVLRAEWQVVNQRPWTPIQLYPPPLDNLSPQDNTILVPYQEVGLNAQAGDWDLYDLYDPETQEWSHDWEIPDSVNFGETQAKHHIEWLIVEGAGSFPYGYPNGLNSTCYGLKEDPYDWPEAFWGHDLTFKAGAPEEAGEVVLRLTIDDNDFDGDQDEDPEGRWLRSGDEPPLQMDIKILVMEVTNLTWEKYSDNNDLGDCPNNGGKSIFPEKTIYSDTADYRNRVNLKISLSCRVPEEPEGKTVQVKVKLFDVDDPKYSAGPVDWETPVKYNDNWCNDRTAQGSDIGASPGSAGSQRETTVTFSAGEQEKPVAVYINDRRPGNNWVAVASTRGGWLNGVHLEADGLTFKDGEDGDVPEQCTSPMLTVWRTLHVETDVMEGEDYPDIGLFYSAFASAYMVVACDTNTDDWDCTYYANFEDSYQQGFVTSYKGTLSADDYWAVSLCGAHDADADHDNDPDSEWGMCAVSYGKQGESDYGGGWRCVYTWVFNETIEDVAAEFGWGQSLEKMKQDCCLHDAAHQFKLVRMHRSYEQGHDCIAAAPMRIDGPGIFCPYCLRDLMKEGRPGNH